MRRSRKTGSLPSTPMSATPTAELNSTTAGTIALASALKGFDGEVQLAERERLAGLHERVLKKEASSCAETRAASHL